MSASVSLGLIGAGLFGESHLQAFRALRHARVTAIFDTDPERARQRAAEFDIPRICASVEEICSLPDLDAIDIVTPEDSHVEPALLAEDVRVFR